MKTNIPNESKYPYDYASQKVMLFLEKVLPNFVPNFVKKLPPEEALFVGMSEPKWNEAIEIFLNTQRCIYDCSFIFKGEPLEGHKKPDIGVISIETISRVPFVCIECKRLPTPPPYTNRLESEYVYGKKKDGKEDGGIERFKLGHHGANCRHNAMLGYIESNDFDFWYHKVNTWIEEKEDWSNDEKLKKLQFNEIATLESQHKRIDKKDTLVQLRHFWIDIQTSES